MKDWSWIELEAEAKRPLFQQLYEQIKGAVIERRLKADELIPPSRDLSEILGLSRTTVLSATRQLVAEGYLVTRQGSGTRVCRDLPAAFRPRLASARLSSTGQAFCRAAARAGMFDFHAPAFCPALPAVDQFPREIWARLAGRIWRRCPNSLFEYGHSQGYEPLREEIACYLRDSRGLNFPPERIMVTNGTQQALNLCARVLLQRGEPAALEDPGYFGARAAFSAAGADLVNCTVDDQGMVPRTDLKPRLICLSPNHQFPLGVTMSLSRRLHILNWASDSGSFVIEDDYDGDLHYHARPPEPLLALDKEERVILLGSFSKVMFPSLRLGYMLLPESLMEPLSAARLVVDRQLPVHNQAVLSAFMKEGHYARHLKKMREVYAERRHVLVKELEGLDLEISENEGGFHLVAWLSEKSCDREAANRCAAAGIEANAVSYYGLEETARPGLLLGFGGVNTQQIRKGVVTLGRALGSLP